MFWSSVLWFNLSYDCFDQKSLSGVSLPATFANVSTTIWSFGLTQNRNWSPNVLVWFLRIQASIGKITTRILFECIRCQYDGKGQHSFNEWHAFPLYSILKNLLLQIKANNSQKNVFSWKLIFPITDNIWRYFLVDLAFMTLLMRKMLAIFLVSKR